MTQLLSRVVIVMGIVTVTVTWLNPQRLLLPQERVATMQDGELCARLAEVEGGIPYEVPRVAVLVGTRGLVVWEEGWARQRERAGGRERRGMERRGSRGVETRGGRVAARGLLIPRFG